MEWERVTMHHLFFQSSDAPGISSKKFNNLAKAQVPTGDPAIAENVHEAMVIHEMIIQKTDGATGSEDEIFSPVDIEDDEEDEDFEDQLALEQEERQTQNNTPNNLNKMG